MKYSKISCESKVWLFVISLLAYKIMNTWNIIKIYMYAACKNHRAYYVHLELTHKL